MAGECVCIYKKIYKIYFGFCFNKYLRSNSVSSMSKLLTVPVIYLGAFKSYGAHMVLLSHTDVMLLQKSKQKTKKFPAMKSCSGSQGRENLAFILSLLF